jgi:hypothetical protein
MKKTSTVRVNGNMIFKGQKLTIGLDLGDHWSCYCVLDDAGNHSGAESGHDTGSDETDIFEDTARSHRHGNGNTFSVGQRAVNGVGIQSKETNEAEREKKKKDDRKVLTLTGLLMEGPKRKKKPIAVHCGAILKREQ